MTNQFQDEQLSCQDCGCTFTFSADDQEFFAQKGFSTPKRCPECRAAKKAQSGGGGRGGARRPRPQFDVKCAACGCNTTVPFEPKGDRPVYCSDCFKNAQ